MTPAAVTVERRLSDDRNLQLLRISHVFQHFLHQQTQSLGIEERLPFSACAVFNDLLICETWPQHKALRGETGKCITIQYIDLDAAQTFEQR